MESKIVFKLHTYMHICMAMHKMCINSVEYIQNILKCYQNVTEYAKISFKYRGFYVSYIGHDLTFITKCDLGCFISCIYTYI
jgi:hypothetical protein